MPPRRVLTIDSGCGVGFLEISWFILRFPNRKNRSARSVGLKGCLCWAKPWNVFGAEMPPQTAFHPPQRCTGCCVLQGFVLVAWPRGPPPRGPPAVESPPGKQKKPEIREIRNAQAQFYHYHAPQITTKMPPTNPRTNEHNRSTIVTTKKPKREVRPRKAPCVPPSAALVFEPLSPPLFFPFCLKVSPGVFGPRCVFCVWFHVVYRASPPRIEFPAPPPLSASLESSKRFGALVKILSPMFFIVFFFFFGSFFSPVFRLVFLLCSPVNNRVGISWVLSRPPCDQRLKTEGLKARLKKK